MKALVVGHTYLAAINQQKLAALAPWCNRLAVLVPSNWRAKGGLFDGRGITPACEFPSFELFTAPVLRSGHVASYVFEPLRVARTLRQLQPDIVHIEQEVYSLPAAQLALAAKRRGAKVSVFGWENLDRPLPLIQRWARRLVLSLADRIVCGNQAGAGLAKQWGFRGPVDVVPQLGVDTATFDSARRSHSGIFTIGYIGRLVCEKGVDTLLRASVGLAGRGRDFRLLSCGSGPEAPALRELAASLGIGERTEWIDSVPHDRVPKLMAALDTLVLPSRTMPFWAEQFGHVLIEAMALGIPVAGSRSGAIPEVIGCDDLIFPENDDRALAGLLDRLVTNPPFRHSAARHGLNRVRAAYTHARVAESTARIWSAMLQGTPGASRLSRSHGLPAEAQGMLDRGLSCRRLTVDKEL